MCVVCESVCVSDLASSSSSSRTIFNATISPVSLSFALNTVPYVPVHVRVAHVIYHTRDLEVRTYVSLSPSPIFSTLS